MNETLLQSFVIASGGLPSIAAILVVLLILSSKRGLASGTAFVSGYTGGYLLIGAATLILSDKLSLGGDSGPSPISSSLFLALGLFLLGLALKKGLNKPSKSKRPKWLQSLDSLQPRKALLFGSIVPFVNIKNLAIYLSAVSTLGDAGLPMAQSLLMLLVVVFIFCIAVCLPVLIALVFRKSSAKILAILKIWLERHNHVLALLILIVFGALFVLKGASGLL